MDKAYYLAYYHLERDHWWFRARSRILADYIRTRTASASQLRILNVGVATGATSQMLEQFGEVSSIEYEQDCIDFIRNKVPIRVEQGSILALPFPEHTFDLVCAFDVVEHVEDHQLAVQELIRVCKPGGSVLITVPAFMDLWSEHDVINHHYRRYTRQQLQRLLEPLPAEVVFLSYFNFLLFLPIYAARKLSRLRGSGARARSDFDRYRPGLLSGLLYGMLRSESPWLSGGHRLPWGVSLLAHLRKSG